MADEFVTVHFIEPCPTGSLKNGDQWTGEDAHFGRTGPPGGTRFAPICDPALPIGVNRQHQASGEPWGATCPACLAILKERGVSTVVPGRGLPDDAAKPRVPKGG